MHKNKSQDEAQQPIELDNSFVINQSSIKSEAGNEGALEVQIPNKNDYQSVDQVVYSPKDILLNFND